MEQIKYNKWLSKIAHENGLAVVLKNCPYIANKLVDYFDMALIEDCHKWSAYDYDECAFFDIFIKKINQL